MSPKLIKFFETNHIEIISMINKKTLFKNDGSGKILCTFYFDCHNCVINKCNMCNTILDLDFDLMTNYMLDTVPEEFI